jgi:hypothetical protein
VESRSPAWRRTTCSFTAPDGSAAWATRSAPWDFDLARWIKRSKVRWIEPGADKAQLRDTGRCPYLDLPGERKSQIFEAEKRRLVPPPKGEDLDPFAE